MYKCECCISMNTDKGENNTFMIPFVKIVFTNNCILTSFIFEYGKIWVDNEEKFLSVFLLMKITLKHNFEAATYVC